MSKMRMFKRYESRAGYLLLATLVILCLRSLVPTVSIPFNNLMSGSQDVVVKCPKKFRDVEHLFNYLEGRETEPCKDMRGIGGGRPSTGFNDGQKMVCFEPEYQMKEHCVVLSFGIGNDWTFDDSMAKLGCQVYAFDPTINIKNHTRSNKIQFFEIGISDLDGFKNISRKICRVLTYKGILTMLDLLHQRISYLKMDVENSEFGVFRNILNATPELLDNVDQIGVEVHPGNYSEPGSKDDF